MLDIEASALLAVEVRAEVIVDEVSDNCTSFGCGRSFRAAYNIKWVLVVHWSSKPQVLSSSFLDLLTSNTLNWVRGEKYGHAG